MSNQISTQTISFNNQTLITFEKDGTQYTAMKPICENIGLAWEAQLARIKRDSVLSQGMIIMITPSNGGEQQMVCLPINYLNGWLFGVNENRIKPEIRETLIKYKKECYQALYDYWVNGKAERKTTVEDRTGLRNAINMLARKKGMIYSDAYQLVHQRFNVDHIDQISSELLPQAVEYVHKIYLEGELIIPENNKAKFELSEDEITDLLWLWQVAENQRQLIRQIEPALQAIRSEYRPQAYSYGIEYRFTIEQARNVLLKISKDLEVTNSWERNNLARVLPRIRSYKKKYGIN